MILIIITHGEAQKVEPMFIFRPLAESGRLQIRSAAKQLRQIFASEIPALTNKQIAIGSIICSPAARCIETAVVLADELKDYTSTTNLRTESRLGERPDRHGLNSDDVIDILSDIDQQVVLLSAHGDFAGALPQAIQILPAEIDIQENGSWFKKRPVLIVMEYEPNKGWENSVILACKSYSSSIWENILST